MIRSFNDKDAERIFRRGWSPKLPDDLQRAALRKLRMLNRSTQLSDLRIPPGNRLEKLRGSRSGQYSLRINSQWRIYFVWRESDAFEVEIVNYHRR